MVRQCLFIVLLFLAPRLSGQRAQSPAGTSDSLKLQDLLSEALRNNPSLKAAHAQTEVMHSRVSQSGSLDDPQLRFMQEGMPDFRFNEAMFSRIEIMQMVPFPGKLSTQSELASIRARAAESDQRETLNEVVTKLKTAFIELWFIQQNLALERQNHLLMEQYLTAVETRYTNGQGSQGDVLKAQVELSMIGNELTSLRQRELSAKAMLGTLLNRDGGDTLGVALMPENVTFELNLDSLLDLAGHHSPMLRRDSLMIDESMTMHSMARQEYLPDFTFGLERITEPMGSLKGWSISAGITIPFAPWTLTKASARVEEARAEVDRSSALYASSSAMVRGSVRDLFYKAVSAKRRLDLFQGTIMAQARQSAVANLAAYKTGSTDFLMLIDSYRTLVSLTKEYNMTRMEFEQTMAELERVTGSSSKDFQ